MGRWIVRDHADGTVLRNTDREVRYFEHLWYAQEVAGNLTRALGGDWQAERTA